MNALTHEFVTVEMRGLKAALVVRARAERVSVSVVVRRAVARELGPGEAAGEHGGGGSPLPPGSVVKVSLRLTRAEAQQLAARAKRAGLSRGAFLGGVLADVPSLLGDPGNRPACLAALTASNAELATLNRNVHHLAALLRQGEVPAAREYRRLLDTLGDDVRTHLSLAASVLADLQPTRRSKVGAVPRRHTTA